MGVTTAQGGVRATFGTCRVPGTLSYGKAAREALRGAGLDLFEWQAEVLEQWLEIDDAERLTRQTAALIVPRRNGKSLLIIARVLFGMMFLNERRVTYTAHRMDTAREVFDSFRALLAHPALSPLVAKVSLAHGKEAVELSNGARFTIRTRTGHGGRGLETDLLIFDEALVLDQDSISALTPLTARAAANGRGQIIYASSAGSLAEESAILLGVRDRGRDLDGTPAESFAYHEYAAERADDPSDPATWAQANPSLGTPILAEAFLAEARQRMNVEAFATEHLGIWAAAGDLPAIDPAAWAELIAETPPVPDEAGAVWLAFDLAPDRTAARVLGFYRSGDLIAVSVLDSITDPAGLDGNLFAQRVLGIAERHDPDVIAFDRLTGAHVEQVLASYGWKTRLRPIAGAKMSNGLATLTARVRLGTLRHDGHPDLAADLSRAIARPFGDGASVHSRKSTTAGTIAGAVALAAGMFLATDERTL